MEDSVPRYFADFQRDQAGSFGELKAGNAAIIGRLDILNGSVARHSKQITDIELRNAARDNSCPLVGELQQYITGLHNQIGAVQSGQDSDRAVDVAHDKSSAKWERWIRPLILSGILTLVALTLEHGKEVAAALKAAP